MGRGPAPSVSFPADRASVIIFFADSNYTLFIGGMG